MRGILFKPDMIKAIAEDRKTVTRRLIKPQPESYEGKNIHRENITLWKWHVDKDYGFSGCPESNVSRWITSSGHFKYKVGEVVYIKEAWCENYDWSKVHFKLDGEESPGPKGFWRSPLFLKARDARYFIRIKDVRAERLQEIDYRDCKKEGLDMGIDNFPRLWDSINKIKWEANPWVFRYEFVKK